MTLTTKQADAEYPDRHDKRSQAGKSPYCAIHDHDRCVNPRCACPCHDAKRPAEVI